MKKDNNENRKELFIKYIDINAKECSDEILKDILPLFQKTLEQAIQIGYRKGFHKAMELVNEKNKQNKKEA